MRARTFFLINGGEDLSKDFYIFPVIFPLNRSSIRFDSFFLWVFFIRKLYSRFIYYAVIRTTTTLMQNRTSNDVSDNSVGLRCLHNRHGGSRTLAFCLRRIFFFTLTFTREQRESKFLREKNLNWMGTQTMLETLLQSDYFLLFA